MKPQSGPSQGGKFAICPRHDRRTRLGSVVPRVLGLVCLPLRPARSSISDGLLAPAPSGWTNLG